MRKSLFILSLLALFISGCTGQNANQEVEEEKLREPLIHANKHNVERENAIIDAYVKRHNLEMKKTGTGLRYSIRSKGTGEPVKEGQWAKVDYTIRLITGEEIYSSKKKGPEEFLVGQDNVETGLHEGIQLMRPGDKAKFILPSHLAYGLTGDNNKIPSRAILVYEIELLSVR